MNTKYFTLLILLGVILSIFLFVTAPPPLLSDDNTSKKISVEKILKILNNENKIVRSIYTKEIVIKGKKSGLKFDEKWQEDGIIAGPLPAQFLRETAKNLERRPVRLGLYLGSDYPINEANKLTGTQLNKFKDIKENNKDQFFQVIDLGIYVYMSADIAIAKACVNCHNKHTQSPKKNWVLNDVMGATTWTYPEEKISIEDAIIMISEFQLSVKKSYERYIKHITSKKNPPLIGKQWPIEGYFLPSTKEFMKKITTKSSSMILSSLIKISNHSDASRTSNVKGL
ncbi:MAG: DUF3365 domain-containing protein [Thiohalomonadales bacterium]